MALGRASLLVLFGFQAVLGDALRPNILFIMSDQHRWDMMGHMGEDVRTPHLDALSKDGVSFMYHYSSTPTCTPARAGLLTGLSPWRHGMLTQGEIAISYTREFPRALADAGYTTALIGKGHYGKHDHGFQHMELYDGVKHEDDDYNQWFVENVAATQPNWNEVNSWQHVNFGYPETAHPTHWTGERAVEYLENDAVKSVADGKPFLLKVSFHRPHSPYDPPDDILNTTSAPTKPSFRAVDGWDSIFKEFCTTPSKARVCGEVDQADEELMRRSYRAAITHVDEQIGKVHDALVRIGQVNNTVIIYTSDHGDHQGDHYLFRKGSPYEGATHIPLIIRWPKTMSNVSVPRGGKIWRPTELRDIFPTMLDIAGKWVDSDTKFYDGRPLTWLVGGKHRWREWVDLEHAKYLFPAWSALTDGSMKFIYWPSTKFHGCLGNYILPKTKFQLFNLTADPAETRDLSEMPEMAAELSKWKRRLVAQYQFEERGQFWLKGGEPTEHDGECLYSPHFPVPGLPTCQKGKNPYLLVRGDQDVVCSLESNEMGNVATPHQSFRGYSRRSMPDLQPDVSFL